MIMFINKKMVNSGVSYLVTFNHSPAGIIKYLEMRKGFHRVKVLQHRSKDLYRSLQHLTWNSETYKKKIPQLFSFEICWPFSCRS